MTEITIVVAETKGGLQTVADAAGGLDIIPGTVQAFDGIETYTDVPMTPVSRIASGKSGWIALARYPD
jgi:hypothetical protein